MQWKTYNIELITPCFCAGADQQKAEIRAPSIRGQLRWWFRALGGTRAEEREIFGGVHGGTQASKIALRVANVKLGPVWKMFPMKINTPGAYIWYYASVAGEKKRWWQTPGKIPNPNGHLPPGTTFDLQIAFRNHADNVLLEKFARALEAFCRFGGIGMRLTRGMGNIKCAQFSADEGSYKKAADEILVKAGFAVKWGKNANKWDDVIFEAEKILKNDLRERFNAKRCPRSPLGASAPRHTSAVYFRVVKFLDDYSLLIFEAPHTRVLAPEFRTREPVIAKMDFANAQNANVVRR